jgi:hypothetical protein
VADETTPAFEEPPGRARQDSTEWVRPLILAISCLVLGFVGGWVARGGEENPVTLPEAGGEPIVTTPVQPPPPAVTETEPLPPAPPPLPERSEVALAVLNGTTQQGLAAQTATRAQGLGYTGATPGNAPAQAGPTVVYFRAGNEQIALRVAQDLGLSSAQVQAFPEDGAFSEAPAGAQVVVVLGPG